MATKASDPHDPPRAPSQADVAAWLQEHLWDVQEKFQRKVSELDNLSPEKRDAFTKEHVLYAIGELTEMIDQIHWKIHRRQEWRQPSRTNIAIDMVDCFKYLLNVCLVWGIRAEDFLKTYADKSRVVEERWNQEFNKPYDRHRFKGIVMVDIDGVLADYANGFFAWIERKANVTLARPFPPRTDIYEWVAGQIGSDRANALKHEYRETGGKLELPVLPGARDMLSWLRECRLYVAIVSARPYRQYRRIMADTMDWLDQHQLWHDALIWEPLKAARIEKEWPDLLCAFEDDLSQAASISAKGFQVLMPNQTYNQLPDTDRTWARYDPARWHEVVVPVINRCLGKALVH